MHLHGHVFQVTEIDGVRRRGAMRDTVLVRPRQTVKVELDASISGYWMLHCHLLYHQAAGMQTVLRYDSFQNQGVRPDEESCPSSPTAERLIAARIISYAPGGVYITPVGSAVRARRHRRLPRHARQYPTRARTNRSCSAGRSEREPTSSESHEMPPPRVP